MQHLSNFYDYIRNFYRPFIEHAKLVHVSEVKIFRPMLTKLATVIGFWKLCQWTWSLTSFLWRHLFRARFQASNNTYKKYSNGLVGDRGTWAVVTGGSDGIGLAICRKLAKEGFNICIVARNENKMK